MTKPPRPGRLPTITLTHNVHERLSELALAAESRLPEVAEYLERELGRACLVAGDALSPSIITIGSRITFVDCVTEQRHNVTLVWPTEENATHHRLSIMTPVGAALIGLRVGQSIDWQNRMGEWRKLRVEAVSQNNAAETP